LFVTSTERSAARHNYILGLQLVLPGFTQHLIIKATLFWKQLALAVIPQLQLRAAESKTDGKTPRQAALCL
jgi:hypothetical protein